MRSQARQIGVLAAAVVAAAAVTCAGIATAQLPVGGKHLTVTPSHGTPSTRFVVNFTTMAATGTSGGTIRTMTIRASGPAHAPSGCTNRIEQGVNLRRAGAQHVGLSAGSGGHWCRGTFSGAVQEEIRPNCTAGMACPQYIALLPIGSFSFTVGAPAASDASAQLPVTPAAGTPSTTFRVKLRRLLVTGPSVTLNSAVYLQSHHHGDCQAGGGEATGDIPDHIRRLAFAPGVAKWCVGSYAGSATATVVPVCKPGTACPAIVRLEQLGHFSFVVRRR